MIKIPVNIPFPMSQVQMILYLAQFILILTNVVVYAILARILMSWLVVGSGKRPNGKAYQFLYDSTEPLIGVARKIPHRLGMIDFAPLIAMFAVDMSGQFLARLLASLVS